MPEYPVDFPLWHGKKKYMPGESVIMSEKLAEPLLQDNTLLVPEDQSQYVSDVGMNHEGIDTTGAEDTGFAQEITEEAIIAAIHKMEPMDATQWTNDGKPQIPALEALLKGKITAKDRDAAWDKYQKETA